MMQDVQQALETIGRTIAETLEKAATLKKAANMIAAGVGLPPPYDDVQVDAPSNGTLRLRSDQFHKEKAPASAARAYLALRGKERGATTSDDIYDALVRGGYDFGPVKESEAKGGLKIALAKDGKVHRIPNGHFGLREWYGIADEERSERGKPKAAKSEAATDGAADANEIDTPIDESFGGDEPAASGVPVASKVRIVRRRSEDKS